MIDKTTRELFIYDDIGPTWAGMVSAEKVKQALVELGPGAINVRVNSYGGSVDEALAMIEVLNRHDGGVTVSVDSIAASAASLFPVVFPSTAASHARVMIHDPWGVSIGNSAEMTKMAGILDKYKESTVVIYALGMTHSTDEIRQMMTDETWFSAEEAKEAGLVDEITEPKEKVKPKDLASGRFKRPPQDLIGNGRTTASTHAPLRIAASLRLIERKIAARRRTA